MLIYDGDCAFCTRSAEWVEARLPLGYPVVAWQTLPSLEDVGLTRDDVEGAAWWLDVTGTPQRGHRAIAFALLAIGAWWALAGRLLLVPPISWLAAVVYALVARYRHRMPGGTAACRVPTAAGGAAGRNG